VIVHLKNAVEMQDVELEERAETITNLHQQLLELQERAPPAPEDPDEIDEMFGVDED
jgi:chemotaxis protein histidine kinase CheA